MPAVELADREQIQGRREESNPGSAANGIQQQIGSVRIWLQRGGHQLQDERDSKNEIAISIGSKFGDDPGVENAVSQRGQGHQKSDKRTGSADVKQCARGADRRANEKEGAERANECGCGNDKRIARLNVVMTASEVMPQFMGQKNRQERNSEGNSVEKKGGVAIGEAKRFEQGLERSSLVVSVSRGKLRACDERSQKSEKKQCSGEKERFGGGMRARRFVVAAMSWEFGPSRRAEKNGSALFWFRRVHKDLLGSGRRGVFQPLEFFAGLEADGLPGRDANFFAGARIATNTGFSGLNAEDPEFAKFDTLAAPESALERLKDGFDGLLRLGAADVGLRDHCVYDVELDHSRPPGIRGPMLEVAARVVKDRQPQLHFYFLRLHYFCFFVRRKWMSVKPDRWIRRMALEHRMIEPFTDRQMREGVISYGVSSYGYDIRVADEFRIFTNVNSTIVDPKHFDPRSLVDYKGDVCIIPPNSFALARSVEYFRIPRNVLTVCLGKSTYARCGIIVNVTPFEPEWEGFVTLEISNTTPLPAKIYANEGLCQVLFFESDEDCEVSYKDKKGKYQAQGGIVLPRL